MPYCIPISIVKDEKKIYFHCAIEEEKIDAMKGNPNVLIACVGAFDRAIKKSLSRTAVWRVDIKEITGKQKKYKVK